VLLELSKEHGELCCTLINAPGLHHTLSLKLQAKHGVNFLFNMGNQSLQEIGSSHSTYLGMREITAAAQLLNAKVGITFEPDRVITTLQFAVETVSVLPSASATPPISNEQNKELTCIALDDDKAPRTLCKGLFKMLGCSSCSQILGEHHHEAANISETVWAAVSKVGMDSVVCLFDENMNYAEGDVLGSDLARKLRSENFTGLIIIRSANDSEESAQKYRAAGADRALSKGTSQKIVAQEIKQILAERWLC